MKKILSLLLAVVMVIGMLPAGAIFASAAEVSETVDVIANTGTLASDSLSISWSSDNVTFTNNKAESSTAIRTSDSNHYRLYAGSSVTIDCAAGNITKIVITATSPSYATALKNSVGAEATASGSTVTIVPTASAASYTIAKMSAQARINAVKVTYSNVDASTCAHTNTETVEAVAATCTTAGNTAGVKCTDCGATLEGNEPIAALGHTETSEVTAATCTEDGYTTYTCSVCDNVRKDDWVDAAGHIYVEGVCSVCSVALPTDLAGKYYIAAIRSSGNYMYMTSDLGTASTKRYQAVDSGVTTLPEEIATVTDGYVFELIENEDGTYKICAVGVDGDNYLGYDALKSGMLVAEADAKNLTVENGETAGTYQISYTADEKANLSLNNNSGNNYFAFYGGTQINDLYLIPVSESAAACEHTNTTTEGAVAATCTTAGSTGTVVCSDCGATVTEATEIAALGHNYVNGVCDREGCGAEEPTEEEGGYVKATSVSVGDTIIIVSEQALMELSSFSTTSTVYGLGTAYTGVPAGTMTWTVEEGTVAGSYAFKNADGNYLYWSSGNSLKTSTTKDAQSSWTVAFDGNDVTLVNAGTVDAARHVVWNSGATRFANYKDSSISGYSTYYTIQFYKYEVAGACTHSWGEWVTTTAPTCTAAGVQTATCTLCNEATTTQPIAATGHTYTYTETAITCANCDYSATYTLSTIADAKAYTDATAVYYVKGIVTYVSGNKIYIEDATGALLVMFNGEDGAGISLGDEILVWDCLTTYNGLIETTYTMASEYVKVSSGNALPSQTVTLADLTADTTNEYLSERVVIENLTIGTINTSGNTALTDSEGNTINIYKVSGLNEAINVNDVVTVTAIVSTYNGYQLLINPDTAAADVVEVEHHDEVVISTVTIAEAKAGTAGEYYQVEGTVTYISGRNVYIQDATGGIVVYLTANAATTQVGDTVKAYGALKNYSGLLELDAVDETNTEFYEILSSGNTVEAQAVTMADLAADTTNEYLAEKITLTGVYVSHYSYNSSYKNVTYYLVDGNGNELSVYRVSVASEEECVAGGSIVNVEAVVSSYNGYQLVTTNDKITVTGTCAHETTQLVNASDATCTATGYTGDTMCTVCGNYTARGEETAALGHSYDPATGVCSVCETTGEMIAVYTSLTEYTTCATMYEALLAVEDNGALYIKLLHNVKAIDVEIYADLYIDMNGCDLTGNLVDNSDCTIYAFDSSTDAYTCGEDRGVFSCTVNSAAYKPEAVVKDATITGTVKRYMAIADGDGYSYHRYYMGITHMSLKPGTTSVGYKAIFAGDEMVQANVASYGYTLQLEGEDAVNVTKSGSFVSGKAVTLRLDNYDVANHGTTPLTASVTLTLKDGSVIESASVTKTMKEMVEAVNNNFDNYNAAQQAAITALVEKYYDTMKNWGEGVIDKIYTPATGEESTESTESGEA